MGLSGERKTMREEERKTYVCFGGKKRGRPIQLENFFVNFFPLFSQLSIGKIRKTGKKKDILLVLDYKFEWWKLGKPRDHPIKEIFSQND